MEQPEIKAVPDKPTRAEVTRTLFLIKQCMPSLLSGDSKKALNQVSAWLTHMRDKGEFR